VRLEEKLEPVETLPVAAADGDREADEAPQVGDLGPRELDGKHRAGICALPIEYRLGLRVPLSHAGFLLGGAAVRLLPFHGQRSFSLPAGYS
jgi:hypothetical protein